MRNRLNTIFFDLTIISVDPLYYDLSFWPFSVSKYRNRPKNERPNIGQFWDFSIFWIGSEIEIDINQCSFEPNAREVHSTTEFNYGFSSQNYWLESLNWKLLWDPYEK